MTKPVKESGNSLNAGADGSSGLEATEPRTVQLYRLCPTCGGGRNYFVALLSSGRVAKQVETL